MINNSVSCVIPALNEEKNISNILISIKNQRLDGKYTINEIIVVDNGSNDRTINISKKLGAVVYCKPNLSIGGLRNYGAEKATGEILVFFDADMILTEDAILSLVSKMGKRNAGALCAHLQPGKKTTWVERTWYYHLKPNGYDLKEIQHLYSGGFAVSRNLFFDVGRFNEYLKIGEDSDLSKRIIEKGFNVYVDIDSVVYNTRYPKNIMQFIKQEFWHGDSFKTLCTHRQIDILTIYFISCLVLFTLCFILYIGYSSTVFIILPLLYLSVPAAIKAFRKTERIDVKFVQLTFIYIAYIISRTASLLKIK